MVLTRNDYCPANQSSRHTLEPGRYPVELVTIRWTTPNPELPYGDGRPYYYRVVFTAVDGTHDYYGRMPVCHTVTPLGAHTVTVDDYAYQLDRPDYRVPVSTVDGWQYLEIERVQS